MKLIDNEIRDIRKYLEEGKPLPDKYRFLLFGEKQEVELVWNGKTNEIYNIVLPFQIVEHIDEPRAEKDAKMQMDLLGFDSRGRQQQGWTNKLIWGDNKLILSSLKNGPLRQEIEENGGIKLIYIDPPFDVGADFSMDIEIGDEQFTKQPTVLEELAYRDTWGKGADSFLTMIYERLTLMRDLLAYDGSIYVHVGSTVSSYVKNLLDEIFGKENFQNNIRWRRMSISGFKGKQKIPFNHETIYYYTKGEKFTFHPEYEEYSSEYMKRFRYADPDGRRFRADQNLGTATTKEKIEEMKKKNLIHSGKDGRMYRKQYLDELPGVPIDDIWTDIPWGTAGNHFEMEVAAFLENCQDIISYVKNYFAVHFKIDYRNADGAISDYYPDFIVKKSEQEIYIIETKGRADLDDPLKLERLKLWCQDINSSQQKIKYQMLYIKQEDYEKFRPRDLNQLIHISKQNLQ